jgi:hypothetical protein
MLMNDMYIKLLRMRADARAHNRSERPLTEPDLVG